MKDKINKLRYNTAGYHPMIDYRNKQYHKNINAIKPFLESIINRNTIALDLGCNAGKYSFMMEEMGARVTGIDFANNAINIAENIAEDIKSTCRFVCGDILEMNFSDNSFDVALLPLNIIEFNYNEVVQMCKKLKQIIKVNGCFCITMQDQLEKRINDMDYRNNYNILDGSHIQVQNIPEKGPYKYQTYFWTVAFAKHVIGQYFEIIESQEYMDNRYFIRFINYK